MSSARDHEPIHRLDHLAMRAAPHLRVVSVSNPDPVFRRHNLIAVARHEDEARKLVVSLESDEDDDARIGVVIMSADPMIGTDTPSAVDPERVSTSSARRAVVGGLIGLVVGAVVIGGATAALTGGAGPVVSAAAGGALFAMFIGAIWAAFTGFGGSDAYRQTFVTPGAVDAAFVSLHTDDALELENARERLADAEGITLVEVDQDGRLVGDRPR